MMPGLKLTFYDKSLWFSPQIWMIFSIRLGLDSQILKPPNRQTCFFLPNAIKSQLSNDVDLKLFLGPTTSQANVKILNLPRIIFIL